jgi:hypothetical protein
MIIATHIASSSSTIADIAVIHLRTVSGGSLFAEEIARRGLHAARGLASWSMMLAKCIIGCIKCK